MNKKNLHRFGIIVISAVLLSEYAPANETANNLMPMPEHLTLNEGRLSIDAGFRISIAGYQDSRISEASSRFLKRLELKTGIALETLQISNQSALEIYCKTAGEKIQSIHADESYTLDVTSRRARLAAPSVEGVLRGLETILQSIDSSGKAWYIPALRIEDRPRFRWRGLLIDVSRHFEPIEIIERNLDAMAAMKMNVLHWHLSDDQGFRVESNRYPKLHLAGSDGQYYSQSQVRKIVAYARSRGIRVVPEFDIPGHTAAWLTAYPELASAPGPYAIERKWGVFDPCMDPTSKKVYSFLDAFIGEMSGLFPDEYFHIGGDEVNGKQWNASSKIRQFKKRNHIKNNHELQAYFNRQVMKILAKHGKKAIGWDEIYHPTLPQNTIIQSWRGQASLAESVRHGFKGILSYRYYLDHMQPASFHYAADPLAKETANLSADERARILGGEACMWAEFVDSGNIESRIWPRAAAIAERLWSPPKVNDVRDMYRRLQYARINLDLLGLKLGYREKLQRMIGDQSVDPLAVLASLLKPAGLSVRFKTHQYTSLTPFNRLVDAIPPESDAARQFADLVEQATGSPDKIQRMRNLLIGWQENNTVLQPMLEQAALLKEIIPLAQTVSSLSKIGVESLDYLASGQKPPEFWRKETAALLNQAEKPQAEIFLAIAAPIRKLAEAAMAIP